MLGSRADTEYGCFLYFQDHERCEVFRVWVVWEVGISVLVIELRVVGPAQFRESELETRLVGNWVEEDALGHLEAQRLVEGQGPSVHFTEEPFSAVGLGHRGTCQVRIAINSKSLQNVCLLLQITFDVEHGSEGSGVELEVAKVIFPRMVPSQTNSGDLPEENQKIVNNGIQ